MNVRHVGLILFLVVQIFSSGMGQQQADIQRYLDKIQRGQADQVKAELPKLLARYQRDAGVIFLQGMLTSDGAEAAKIFQSVVDNFPESEWADDALYKVYQFYYSLGLYKTAEEKRAELRRKYPESEYVTGKKETRIAARATRRPAPGPPQPASGAQPPNRPKPVSTGSAYSVQVGAFREMGNASSLKNFFQGEGYEVEVRSKVLDRQSLHAVWVGSFTALEDARRFSLDLQAKYRIDSFVVAR
ncbi:MAG: SPOR domain-containing protein [Bacteroidota bacterium]